MFTINAMLVAICCRIRPYCVAFRGARNAQFWGCLKMALDANGEWDGICACGRTDMNGQRCFLGATHKPLPKQPTPWAIPSAVANVAEPSLPWMQKKLPWE